MKDMIKTVVVLCSIAIIAGLMLGVVNSCTQVDAEEQLKKKMALVYEDVSALTKVETTGVVNPENGEVEYVYSAADGTYVLLVLGKGGYGGDVELLFAIKDSVITAAAGYSHSETPGLGAKGFTEEYLSNYVGKNISGIEAFTVVKTDPNADSEIKAVTSATYSSNAIANAANAAVYWYNTYGPGAEEEA